MRTRSALIALVLAGALVPASSLGQASKHNLKPGATGEACLGCHVAFKDVLKRASVHTPVKARECTGCHSPHAADHGKLLATEPEKTCAACHQDMAPKSAKSVHRPVSDGKCTGCHDPHATANKFNLVKGGPELCAGCHKEIATTVAKATAKHKPVEQGGCVTCHLVHGSAAAPDLLKKGVPGLCLDCHKTDKPIFVKQHVGYTVAKADCTSCHDPHGSTRRGMLFERVHAPVAKGMCAQCHQAAGSANQFTTKQQGGALCKGCHIQKVLEMMGKNRIHAPVVGGDACLNCHAPHAAKAKGLLRGSMTVVCGGCHPQSVRRAEQSETKHPPVVEGDCTSCHDPHSGDRPLLLANPNVVDMCATCHDWLKHNSHKMGDAVRDPRNPNLRVDCMSCHRGHGTEFKKMLLQATQPELCTKCHTQYRG